MVRTILILPDVHLKQSGCTNEYKLVKKFLSQIKPDYTILLGDFMECESISHWLENKRELLENKRFQKECQVANQELDFLQMHSKQVIYLEGNHEDWVTQYIEKQPSVKGLIEIPKMLSLGTRKIKWVPMNKPYHLGKMYFIHGIYIYKYHSHKHLTMYGCSICYGHTHTAQTFQMNMKMQDPIMAYGLGCLCDHEPYYMRGRPANWINQFGWMELEGKTGRFNLTPVNITKGQFIFNSKIYK